MEFEQCICEPKIYINISGLDSDQINLLFKEACFKAVVRFLTTENKTKAILLTDFKEAEGQISLDKLLREYRESQGMYIG